MSESCLAPEDESLILGSPKAIRGFAALAKRLLDLFGTLIAVPIAAPLMIGTAVVLKLSSRDPILFIQERAGEGGKVFKIYKFRTMVVNAEDLLDQVIDVDALEEPVFKLKDDPRVTRVGRFLRRWSLDELPQLYNVLRGEMSLVGPRPEETWLVERYSEWHRMRLMAKPGVTGPVQINGRGDLPLQERVRLEVEYINHYSLWKDLAILFKTIPVVIRGNGSY